MYIILITKRYCQISPKCKRLLIMEWIWSSIDNNVKLLWIIEGMGSSIVKMVKE